MADAPDLDDPNVLFSQPHECRIYGDDMAQTWAVVSPQRYQACIKYRWRWKASNARNGKAKKYLSRNRHVNHANGGVARDNRTQENCFLHTYILEELIGTPRPSPNHIVDHRDGDETNCTDENLRWATLKFNANNKHGKLAGKEHDHAASI